MARVTFAWFEARSADGRTWWASWPQAASNFGHLFGKNRASFGPLIAMAGKYGPHIKILPGCPPLNIFESSADGKSVVRPIEFGGTGLWRQRFAVRGIQNHEFKFISMHFLRIQRKKIISSIFRFFLDLSIKNYLHRLFSWESTWITF